MSDLLTASRMSTAMRCLRQYFWQCEVGLTKLEVSHALKFGSAWARAMDARWGGAEYEDALDLAIPDDTELDEFTCASFAALLAGYYDHYKNNEIVETMHPEVQFEYDLGLGFKAAGKLDGLGTLKDGRSVIIEAKTTRDSLDHGSEYWMRLAFNMQVYQYILAARHHGWDIGAVFYDVTRKPQLSPMKSVCDVDKKGLKIVRDKAGKRVKVASGRNKGEWRQSGDPKKGYAVQVRPETTDEFCDRVWKQVKAQPDFYFARKEIPIIDQQLESFERQRIAIAKLILSLRDNESGRERDPEAWPRNVSRDTCNFCSFKSFCLQNISVDINNPPAGYEVRELNPELNEKNDSTTKEDDGQAAI